MKTQIERIIYILIIFLCFIGMYNGCNENKAKQNLLNSVNDTLTKTINKLGQEKASTDLLLGTYKDFKAMHVADSSAIGKLKKLVDKLTISATYLSNVTGNTFVSTTQTIVLADTVKIDSILVIYPEYKTKYENKWERFSITANKDSFAVDYKVFNEFNIVQEWKRNGIFKRKTPEVSILSLNPHTETKELKTFTVKENKSNRLRDFLLGVLASAIVTTGINLIK
ncbi:MAG: hypothetical protein Q7W13_13020 [Bacteroidia bacterium]|nr:hypothetical protein [Bacteroidia bacterium]